MIPSTSPGSRPASASARSTAWAAICVRRAAGRARLLGFTDAGDRDLAAHVVVAGGEAPVGGSDAERTFADDVAGAEVVDLRVVEAELPAEDLVVVLT